MKGFSSDSQRRAMFANMNRFSKGRIPNIGETIYVHGDDSVGMPSWEGKVVATHKNSVDVKYATKYGEDVAELGLEEFDDEEDMKGKQEFEGKLYADWLNEQSTKKLQELWADVAMSGREDKILRGVLADRRTKG